MRSGWSLREATGLAIGALGSIGAAAVLVSVRGQLANADVALILMVFVLAGALVGGRTVGVFSALVAAASFDFFFTEPYRTLKIANREDVITTLILLAVGAILGEVAGWSARLGQRLREDRSEIKRLHRVAELAARGETEEDMILVVTAELIATLRLQDCTFERPPFVGELPVMERNGQIGGRLHHYTREGFELPREGAQLLVVGAGRTVGRFRLAPTHGVGVSPERRLIAIALADQLGAVIAWRTAA
jgi:hypothetical protein